MDRFSRYWWLGARLLVYTVVAWLLATLPLTIGGAVLREMSPDGPLRVALIAAGAVYAVIGLPAVFAVLALPLPADTPVRPRPAPPTDRR